MGNLRHNLNCQWYIQRELLEQHFSGVTTNCVREITAKTVTSIIATRNIHFTKTHGYNTIQPRPTSIRLQK